MDNPNKKGEELLEESIKRTPPIEDTFSQLVLKIHKLTYENGKLEEKVEELKVKYNALGFVISTTVILAFYVLITTFVFPKMDETTEFKWALRVFVFLSIASCMIYFNLVKFFERIRSLFGKGDEK